MRQTKITQLPYQHCQSQQAINNTSIIATRENNNQNALSTSTVAMYKKHNVNIHKAPEQVQKERT